MPTPRGAEPLEPAAGPPPVARALFVFVDGIGWGSADPDRNPFARAALPHFARLLGRAPWSTAEPPSGPALALDATMGVAGRPQSGTGQAALVTGCNTAALLGAHRGPFPDPALRPVLAWRSLWRDAVRAGAPSALATAYPQRLRAAVAAGRGRLSSIARAAVLAGVPLRAARLGGADGAVPPILGPRPGGAASAAPIVGDARAAGEALAEVASHHVLTVYEHFEADMVGHRADRDAAVAALERLDALLGGIADHWAATDLLVLASDHGNLEDATTRHHTLAPAIGAWRGPRPFAAPTRVYDVAPALRAALGWRPHDREAAHALV